MGAVIVTGAAGGLGSAFVAALAGDGRTVIAFDRADAPGAAASYRLDVADEAAVNAAVAEVRSRHGAVEALICAAGIVREAPVAEMTLADWRAVIDASLTGTFLAVRAVLPGMIAAERGSIVAFSSGYATSGYRNGANYAAAKAGVEALIKSAALEAAVAGVRANCIAPGPFATPMLSAERRTFIEARIPLGRVGLPNDLMGLVRFLIGDESAYITGQTLHVNGGLLMP
jgi:NAD(P)-dependent dehydrogenase (short-subunit alcohol dehydrogenase family)